MDTHLVMRIAECWEDNQGQTTTVAAAQELLDLDAPPTANVAEVPIGLPIADASQIWGWVGRRPLPLARAILPSQRSYLVAATEAVNDMATGLSYRRDLPAGGAHAVITACALLLSAQITNTCTLTAWDPRRQKVIRANRRAAWGLSGVFAEAGPMTVARDWRVSTGRLLRQLLANIDDLSSPVTVVHGDAADPGLPDGRADAVLWDPPVYDNIEYVSVSRPHELILAGVPSVAKPLSISLTGTPKRLPTAAGFESNVGDDSGGQDSPTFDKERYEDDLRAQGQRARRLLRDGGRVGVFWPVRDPAGLQSFLDLVAPVGLELSRAFRLAVSHTLSRSDFTYLLLLDVVGDSARLDKSQVDAATILELADRGAPSLYQGLADVLLRHWDEDDIARNVPPGFRGSRLSRVAELVATDPAPEATLVELGRSALREELSNLSVDSADLQGDVRSLARGVLRVLGFGVADPIGFSIPVALQEAQHASQRILLCRTREDARASFGTVVTLVERVLRYTTVAWAQAACGVGGNWMALLDEVVQETSSKRYGGPRTMAFGDWKAIFCGLPKRLQEQGLRTEVFGPIAGAMRRGKIDQKMSALVTIRNSVAHDRPELDRLQTHAYVDRLYQSSESALEGLRALNSQRQLPMTLQPVEEVRDRYGRRRLVLADAAGGITEIFVQDEADLSRPIVYLPSGSNPRDVEPILLASVGVEHASELNTE
jgi:hypothetical protein